MKKFWGMIWVLVCAFCMLSVNVAHAQLNSAGITGEREVLAGRSYTYTATVNASTGYYVAVICSGVFEASDCPVLLSTSGGQTSAAIKVSVKGNAQPGETGSISLKGSGDVLDENGIPVEQYDIRSIFTATVIAENVPLPSEPVPEATPQPSPASAPKKDQTLLPSASPNVTEPTAGDYQMLYAQIKALGQGGSATFTANRSALIPLDALSILKQKRGSLTLVFGSYTCTINGASLDALPADTGMLDLSLSLLKDGSLSNASGGLDVYQLHFAHVGTLPGAFYFGFPAPSHQPGDTLFLYHYDASSGLVEYKNSAVVDENGWVMFEIRSCSSFFVTDTPLDEITISPASPQHSLKTASIAELDDVTELASSKAPDYLTLPFLIGALLFTAGASVFITLHIINRRKKN